MAMITVTSPNNNITATQEPGTNIAAIVAPCVIGGVLIIIVVLTIIILKVKEKRREEGTYNPSGQEQQGPRAGQPGTGLKLPPEERLI
ncbi:protein crumbs homolog 3a [Callorhinchus milii]|uniref:Crumbs-like 3a n=1 Tax=Callorhinchus milii TaxID=7868 RepID=V9LF18_CALMI|nr:protein crumbs homolog 3a [Callorhinchus milii]